MIPTTIIPKVVKPKGDEQRHAELVVERGQLVERISAAWKMVGLSSGHEETRHWRAVAHSLQIDLEMVDASLKYWGTPKDERYAEVRAQMRYHDQLPGVVSNGSVDWENS